MDESAILSALQKAVTAAVAASSNPSFPVAHVSKSFVTPTDGKFLELVWIPNNPTGSYWGNQRDYQGMMRLVLHWPNNGDDAYKPLAVLQSICAGLTKDTILPGVKISDTPSMTGSPIPQGNEILYPASFRYQSHRSS